jgi:hypothetical protein
MVKMADVVAGSITDSLVINDTVNEKSKIACNCYEKLK